MRVLLKSVLCVVLLGACGANRGQQVVAIGTLPELAAPAPETLVRDLDASGDGRVSSEDWQIFEHVAHAAAAGLGVSAMGADLHAAQRLYNGPHKDAPSVFAYVRQGPEGADLSGVPPERLFELAVESRWRSLQARLVALDPEEGRPERLVGGLWVQRFAGYDAKAMEPAHVCGALRGLDISPWERAGLPAVALFDLDSTIWAGNVMDVFLDALIEHRLPRPEANAGLQAYLKKLEAVDAARVDASDVLTNATLLLDRWTNTALPERQRPTAKDTFEQMVGLLTGVSVDEVTRVARAGYERGSRRYPAWAKRVYADRDGCGMREILRLLQERGIKTYLLSATLDPLAREGAHMLGVSLDLALGSLLEIKDGKYTGRIIDSPYYIKGWVARQWLPAPPVVAFGDSPSSDFPMLLEALGPAFMINARDSFRERDMKEAGARLVELNFDGTEEEAWVSAK